MDNPSEYNERTDDTGMGGDYGWYDHMTDLDEDDDPEYIEAWNDCGDGFRIYPDGEILGEDEIEDDEEDEDEYEEEDWDDEDE